MKPNKFEKAEEKDTSMTVREAREYWYGDQNFPPLSESEIALIVKARAERRAIGA